MAQQSRDWRRSGQSRDDQSRQGRNPQWSSGSDFDFDEEQQGYPRGAERNQDSQYGRSYERGRMEGGIRGTGGSGYEDEYRGSSQGGGYGGGSSSGWQDETRFGSSRGGREGRDYTSRGYSGESRGQSWGDREQFSGGDYEQFSGRGGGYYGTSGSYGSLGPGGGNYYGSGSQTGSGSGSRGDWLSRLEGKESYGGQRSGSMARQEQNFRGRGPKGYQRSDERIKEAVCEELSDDPQIDASEISVSVSSGTVTLTGTVNDRRTKYEVEEMVCACSGVQEVDNQLRVQSQSGQSATSQAGSGSQSGAQSTKESSGGSRSTSQGSSSSSH